MNSKITVTFALFCLLQTSNSQNIFADLNIKIAAAKRHVVEVIHSGGQQLGQTRSTISRLIFQVETNIQNQLNQLNNIVDEAIAEAGQKGADISTCLDDLNQALSAEDFRSFRICRSQDELNLLGVNLGNLGIVKRNLSSSISKCSSIHNGDNDGLKVCVQNDIDSAQVRVDALQEEINSVCDDAIKNAQACTRIHLERLDGAIDKIAHNLKTCLVNIL